MATFLGQSFRPICRFVIYFCKATWKAKTFKHIPADLHNIKQRIYDEITATPPAMLDLLCVMGLFLNRVHQYINPDAHPTGVIFKKHIHK